MKKSFGVVNLLLRKALDNKPLTLMGNGLHLRDYLYIDDAITALILAADNCKNDILNLASGRGVRNIKNS